ncbi:hypothetical protein HED48_23595 [Ochrobactrum intermedium]|nr:hypothetical protein [Brucella intermedia]
MTNKEASIDFTDFENAADASVMLAQIACAQDGDPVSVDKNTSTHRKSIRYPQSLRALASTGAKTKPRALTLIFPHRSSFLRRRLSPRRLLPTPTLQSVSVSLANISDVL